MTPTDGIDEPGAFLDAMALDTTSDDQMIGDTLDLLIGKHAPDALARAILPRVGDLRGVRGEVILGLIEGLGRDDLWDALANALVEQPRLAADRTWMALEILEGTGRVEDRPTLVELREEIEDLLTEEVPLSDLAKEIEADPDAIPAAIDALTRIEEEVRTEIIVGLGFEAPSPSLIALLRSLAQSHDTATRNAAEYALRSMRRESQPKDEELECALLPSSVGLIGSVVGPLDSDGRGSVLLLAKRLDGYRFARVECDVREGVVAVGLERIASRDEAAALFDEAAERLGSEAARDCPVSARLLVAGSALLSGGALADQVGADLREAFGDDFEPRPVFAVSGEFSVGGLLGGNALDDARAVLSRRMCWYDGSPLASDLAAEARLRDGELPLDPARDPGPFRVLFEGRVLDRIELYRRMLLWSAMVWQEAGEPDLSRAALRLVAGLADEQNAVPGYPFLEQLMIRSLS